MVAVLVIDLEINNDDHDHHDDDDEETGGNQAGESAKLELAASRLLRSPPAKLMPGQLAGQVTLKEMRSINHLSLEKSSFSSLHVCIRSR